MNILTTKHISKIRIYLIQWQMLFVHIKSILATRGDVINLKQFDREAYLSQ